MSFLLQKEEEERVTAKNRQAESLCVLKIEHMHLAVARSTTSQHTVTLVINKM